MSEIITKLPKYNFAVFAYCPWKDGFIFKFIKYMKPIGMFPSKRLGDCLSSLSILKLANDSGPV